MKPRIEDKDIPAGKCRCPACNGDGVIALSEGEKAYPWNKGVETRKCNNCGGQYMYCSSKGYVSPTREGDPCLHQYTYKKAGNCLHDYTCIHCGDYYQIDSGD